MDILEELFKMQDKKYRKFNLSLIPGLEEARTIGIRIPEIRKFAKKLDDDTKYEFISTYPHYYIEENSLHRFIIEGLKDYDEVIYYLDCFVPFIDNWSVCDGFTNKQVEKNKDKYILKIKEWLTSSHLYTKRFAVSMLMRYYLNDDFKTEYLDLVGSIETNEYYLEMMIAWYFATALAKQYDDALKYLEDHQLNNETYKMLLGKVRDTFRISDDRKEIIKELLWKKMK